MTVHGSTQWPLRACVTGLALLLAAVPVAAAIFTDIQGLPAQRAIERLAAKGIFRGTTGTTFNPNGTVTRGDFAVLLVRALGLDTQGLTLPAFKDSSDIPRDQQGAVAAMTRLGSASPQKVEVRKGPLVYTLTVDKTVYAPDERILITFKVENTGGQDIKFEYATSQFHDLIIRNAKGEEVAKWSLGRAFTPMNEPVPLAAKQKLEFQPTWWKQLDQSDDPVDAGRYEIIAIHTTKTNPTSLSLFFNKGVMAALPDNTFRPKQEITRLDLATVTARAMGLADAAPASLNVTDANDVPPSARGTVAAAIDKRLIATVGNREFRPAQKATRSEVAQALDVTMDALKRYNFSKGTLKDPVTGTPPQITIEDERKALRTFRVARNHAVYRNDRPVELRDLRPGDTVLFLNIGDVGDVAYIEATGR